MDHVRGSSLAWPESLDTLRPFIMTWWSGRTVADMPKEIKDVFDEANFRQPHLNIGLVVLNSDGKVLRAVAPRIAPPHFRFDPELQGKDFKNQLDSLIQGLELPKHYPVKIKLSLPDVCSEGNPRGVRIYLTFEPNRLNHYRTPIVEAVAFTEEMRKALQFRGTEQLVQMKLLRPVLEQIYPAAIMDGKGDFRSIEGNLKLIPGDGKTKDGYRYSILRGNVRWLLDNTGRTAYEAKLELLLKYKADSGELHSLCGYGDSAFPKGPETIRMKVAIESLPD